MFRRPSKLTMLSLYFSNIIVLTSWHQYTTSCGICQLLICTNDLLKKLLKLVILTKIGAPRPCARRQIKRPKGVPLGSLFIRFVVRQGCTSPTTSYPGRHWTLGWGSIGSTPLKEPYSLWEWCEGKISFRRKFRANTIPTQTQQPRAGAESRLTANQFHRSIKIQPSRQ